MINTYERHGSFKILKPYEDGINPSTNGLPRVLPGIHDLKVRLWFKKPYSTGQQKFTVKLKSFEIRKEQRLKTPENRGFITIPEVPAIPNADVPVPVLVVLI